MVGGAGPGQALFSRASLDRDPHMRGRPPLGGQSSSLGNQSPLSFLSGKDFVALAIENAHADRLRRPLYVRGGDDCRRRVRHFNLFFRQIHWPLIERSANKLNPERPRLFRDDLRRFADWDHARTSGGRRPTRPDSSLAPSRPHRPLAPGGAPPHKPHRQIRASARSLRRVFAPSFPGAKATMQAYPRPLFDAGPCLGARALATARRLPNGSRNIRPLPLTDN